MNVLSLFDGMSCGRLALERADIPVNMYMSSEVDKYAIQVADKNYPQDSYFRLGDVRDIDATHLPKIDLLIGGSPCQGFSFAGKREGAATECRIKITTLEQYLELKAGKFEFKGQSYLFWEFMRLLQELKPKYFLLENVVMTKKWEKILSEAIDVEPIMINSSLVSAQNRKRLYWTNIPNVTQPEDRGLVLDDIIINNTGYVGGAMRGRYVVDGKRQDHKMKTAGLTTQRIETRKDSKSNALTTVGKDTLLVERPCEPKHFDGGSLCHHVADATDINGHESIKRVYGGGGKCPTLNTCTGGNREPKILLNESASAGNKSHCLTASYTGAVARNSIERKQRTMVPIEQTKEIAPNNYNGIKYRKLLPIECERLQTVPDDYTDCVSNSQRYKMLGNGWTIDVIAHIFRGLKYDS